MNAIPEWVNMARSLGFGDGQPLYWSGIGTDILTENMHETNQVIAIELPNRISAEVLHAVFQSAQFLRSGLVVKVGSYADARKFQQKVHSVASVTTFGVLEDYYTAHIPHSVGEAAALRYCVGLRRDPGRLAAVKRWIKLLLTYVGMGKLLYDYCLVFLEFPNVDR